YNPLTIIFYIFIFDAIGCAFLADFGEIGTCIAAAPSRLLYIAFYALFSTVAPYLFYTKGLEHLENSRASVIVAIEPVVATVVGFVMYSERPTVPAIIGIVLVLAAIFMMSRPDKKQTEN
ncbi:MAG: DMT family transporter, partial [Oscillospiraceae bacterium]|nr:DMT family transporter [Oscillospiraceae bacterium]